MAKEFLARNQVPYRSPGRAQRRAQRLLAAARLQPDADALPVVFLPDGVVASPALGEATWPSGSGCRPRRAARSTTSWSSAPGPAGLGAAVYGGQRGPAHAARRAGGHRRPGRAEQPDRELPRLPRRRLRRRARAAGPRAGGAVRGRDRSPRDEVHRHRAARRRPGACAFADGAEVDGARRRAGHRGRPTRGCRPGRRRAGRARRLLRRGGAPRRSNCRGQDVLRRRGGQLAPGRPRCTSRRSPTGWSCWSAADSLRSRCREYLVARIEEPTNIEVRTCTRGRGRQRRDHLEQLVLRDAATGEREQVDGRGCSSSSARCPRPSGWATPFVRDDRGFLLHRPGPAGPDGVPPPPGGRSTATPYLLESSVPGVFVAGDVRAASVKRVASAVGEGALAVTLVHRYLEESMTETGRPTGGAARPLPLRGARPTSSSTGWPQRAKSRMYDAGATRPSRGRARPDLFVLLDGAVRLSPPGAAARTSSSTRPATAAPTPARPGPTSRPGRAVQQQRREATRPAASSCCPRASSRPSCARGSRWRCTCSTGSSSGCGTAEATVRQREHLAQLATLSANLAHELNNPAAAAVRATEQLRDRVAGMRHKLGMIAEGRVSADTIAASCPAAGGRRRAGRQGPPRPDPVQEADLEDVARRPARRRWGSPGATSWPPCTSPRAWTSAGWTGSSRGWGGTRSTARCAGWPTPSRPSR